MAWSLPLRGNGVDDAKPNAILRHAVARRNGSSGVRLINKLLICCSKIQKSKSTELSALAPDGAPSSSNSNNLCWPAAVDSAHVAGGWRRQPRTAEALARRFNHLSDGVTILQHGGTEHPCIRFLSALCNNAVPICLVGSSWHYRSCRVFSEYCVGGAS